jgi:hypothetical protein
MTDPYLETAIDLLTTRDGLQRLGKIVLVAVFGVVVVLTVQSII